MYTGFKEPVKLPMLEKAPLPLLADLTQLLLYKAYLDSSCLLLNVPYLDIQSILVELDKEFDI